MVQIITQTSVSIINLLKWNIIIGYEVLWNLIHAWFILSHTFHKHVDQPNYKHKYI